MDANSAQQSCDRVAITLGETFDFQQTTFAGVYEIESNADKSHRELFAVNLAPEESRLEYLSSEQLRTLAESLTRQLLTMRKSLFAMQNERANGRELWRWFLVGLCSSVR